MKRHRRVLPVLLVCFLFVGAIASPAYAYIDPNAAGWASQIITPLLVVAAASLTFFRQGIAEVFCVFGSADPGSRQGPELDVLPYDSRSCI